MELKTIGAPKEQVPIKDGVRQRVSGREVTIFELSGDSFQWTPKFHVGVTFVFSFTRLISSQFDEDLEDFVTFHRHVEQCYHRDQPLCISYSELSPVKVLSQAEYSKMSANEVQTLLKTKHMVITDIPNDTVQFDEDGLQILTNLDAQIDIRGKPHCGWIYLSYSPVEFEDHSVSAIDLLDIDHSPDPQLCSANLEHVLFCGRDPKAPIVNTLMLPMPLSAIEKSPFGSDIEAWRLTEGMELCDAKTSQYPTAEMRWGYASTAGARQLINMMPDGLGAYVEIRCGGEWWLLFSEGEEDSSEFTRLDSFTKDFEIQRPPTKFHVEAVYLTPGTRLRVFLTLF